MDVRLVDRADALPAVVAALARSETIPLDAESNGLHAYRPVLCTLQLGVVEAGEVTQVFVLDAITLGDTAMAALSPVLARGPRKIVHDLAFDARMLVQHGLPLADVDDTAVAARFLGIAATGLASLLQSRIGVGVDKALQHHDWGKRPLDPSVLAYLGADVAYLPALARSLLGEAQARDVLPEVEEETAYRLASALATRPDTRPAWARVKGAVDLDAPALGALSRLAEIREQEARRLDVPVHTVLGADPLLELARLRTPEAVRRLAKGRAAPLTEPLIEALSGAPADVSPEERALYLAPAPRMSRDERELRKRCEGRLRGLRRAVAAERGVDEQVVLPGHCLSALVALAPTSLADLEQVPGLGARRIERDGVAILAACAPPVDAGVIVT